MPKGYARAKHPDLYQTSSTVIPPEDGVPSEPALTAEQAEELKKIEAESKTEEKPKKKRRKMKVEDEIQQFLPALPSLSTALLEFLAARMPNPIPPTEAETDLFTKSLNAVILKRADFLIEYLDLGMLAFSVVLFVLPRAGKKKKEEVESKSRADTGQVGERKDVPHEKAPVESQPLDHS